MSESGRPSRMGVMTEVAAVETGVLSPVAFRWPTMLADSIHLYPPLFGSASVRTLRGESAIKEGFM